MSYVQIANYEIPYAQINKTGLDDPQLSLRGKGLLAYLLSKPPHWQVRKKDLLNHTSDGLTVVDGALHDLLELGYIFYFQKKSEDGTFGDWVYLVFQTPEQNPYLEESIAKGQQLKEAKKNRNKKKNDKLKQPEVDNPITEPKTDYPKADYPKADKTMHSNNDFSNNDLKEEEEEEEVALGLLKIPSLKLLSDLSVKVGFSEEMAMDLVKHVNTKKISNLTADVIMDSFAMVQADIQNGQSIVDMAKWTAGKIERVAKQPKLNIEPKQTRNIRKGSNSNKYDFKRTELTPGWFEDYREEERQRDNQTDDEQNKINEAILYLKDVYEKEFGQGRPFTDYLKWEDEQYSQYDVTDGDQLGLSLAIKKIALKQRLDRLHQAVN